MIGVGPSESQWGLQGFRRKNYEVYGHACRKACHGLSIIRRFSMGVLERRAPSVVLIVLDSGAQRSYKHQDPAFWF